MSEFANRQVLGPILAEHIQAAMPDDLGTWEAIEAKLNQQDTRKQQIAVAGQLSVWTLLGIVLLLSSFIIEPVYSATQRNNDLQILLEAQTPKLAIVESLDIDPINEPGQYVSASFTIKNVGRQSVTMSNIRFESLAPSRSYHLDQSLYFDWVSSEGASQYVMSGDLNDGTNNYTWRTMRNESTFVSVTRSVYHVYRGAETYSSEWFSSSYKHSSEFPYNRGWRVTRVSFEPEIVHTVSPGRQIRYFVQQGNPTIVHNDWSTDGKSTLYLETEPAYILVIDDGQKISTEKQTSVVTTLMRPAMRNTSLGLVWDMVLCGSILDYDLLCN